MKKHKRSMVVEQLRFFIKGKVLYTVDVINKKQEHKPYSIRLISKYKE